MTRFILVLSLATLVGCTRVGPTERGRLAHPSMRGEDPAGQGEQHLRAVHEGAVGGSLDATNGCGCN